MKLTSALLHDLRTIVNSDNLLTDPSECLAYSYDNSRYQGMPEAVVFVRNAQQTADVLKLCYAHEIPVYTRGKGSATTGASVPLHGGIVLSMERMNKILSVDTANRVMVAEPGVTNEQVQMEAARQGFFWAPDPSSGSTCTLGGNLACNAAGPRAVKYGSCRENTLGLQAVTGTGEIIRTGVYTTKGVVGYDLTRLLIGSEGSLAVITEANLKLLPRPEDTRTLRALYSDIESCTAAIAAMMAQPIIPCALEFIDEKAMNAIRDYTAVEIAATGKALLMIEIDGEMQALNEAAEKVMATASCSGLIDIKIAKTQQERQDLWKMRKALSPALKKIAPKKINEDVVVPVAALPEFIAYTHQLAAEYAIHIVNFGHAGNGNIHVNLLLDPSDPIQEKHAHVCLEKIFAKVLALKGTLSGEHGVGYDKKNYIAQELDAVSLKLMRQIKQVFDPKGILNPGKVLPEK